MHKKNTKNILEKWQVDMQTVFIINIAYKNTYMKDASFFIFLFLLFRAEYGSSQDRGTIGVTAAGLHHSHSNAGSKTHLLPTPELMAMLDP